MKARFKKEGFTLLELLVVIGIFTLIIGGAFTLLSSGKLSVSITEARIQAAESARLAMSRITKDLRLSHSSRVYIYEDLDEVNNPPLSGNVVYFQVPVLKTDGTLDLSGAYLKWGSEDVQGAYIQYHLGGPNADQLFRSSCSAVGIGVSCAGVQVGVSSPYRLIAPHISSLSFTRTKPVSDLIEIEIVGEGKSVQGPITQTLNSGVKLRN